MPAGRGDPFPGEVDGRGRDIEDDREAWAVASSRWISCRVTFGLSWGWVLHGDGGLTWGVAGPAGAFLVTVEDLGLLATPQISSVGSKGSNFREDDGEVIFCWGGGWGALGFCCAISDEMMSRSEDGAFLVGESRKSSFPFAGKRGFVSGAYDCGATFHPALGAESDWPPVTFLGGDPSCVLPLPLALRKQRSDPEERREEEEKKKKKKIAEEGCHGEVVWVLEASTVSGWKTNHEPPVFGSIKGATPFPTRD